MRERASPELEPSVSVVTPKEPERAATMPTEPRRTQEVLLEGTLGRKHDVEGSGKKASIRYKAIKGPQLHHLTCEIQACGS